MNDLLRLPEGVDKDSDDWCGSEGVGTLCTARLVAAQRSALSWQIVAMAAGNPRDPISSTITEYQLTFHFLAVAVTCIIFNWRESH